MSDSKVTFFQDQDGNTSSAMRQAIPPVTEAPRHERVLKIFAEREYTSMDGQPVLSARKDALAALASEIDAVYAERIQELEDERDTLDFLGQENIRRRIAAEQRSGGASAREDVAGFVRLIVESFRDAQNPSVDIAVEEIMMTFDGFVSGGAEPSEDTKRLDWLESTKGESYLYLSLDVAECSVREAIDAARRSPTTTEPRNG